MVFSVGAMLLAPRAGKGLQSVSEIYQSEQAQHRFAEQYPSIGVSFVQNSDEGEAWVQAQVCFKGRTPGLVPLRMVSAWEVSSWLGKLAACSRSPTPVSIRSSLEPSQLSASAGLLPMTPVLQIPTLSS